MTPLYGWGSTASRLEPLRGGSFLFTTKFQEIPGTHYQPQKDERLSWPWSHPVVLNTGPMDWESSILNTRPLENKPQTKARNNQEILFNKSCKSIRNLGLLMEAILFSVILWYSTIFFFKKTCHHGVSFHEGVLYVTKNSIICCVFLSSHGCWIDMKIYNFK